MLDGNTASVLSTCKSIILMYQKRGLIAHAAPCGLTFRRTLCQLSDPGTQSTFRVRSTFGPRRTVNFQSTVNFQTQVQSTFRVRSTFRPRCSQLSHAQSTFTCTVNFHSPWQSTFTRTVNFQRTDVGWALTRTVNFRTHSQLSLTETSVNRKAL